MALPRFHPLATVSALSFVMAMFLPYVVIGLRPSPMAQVGLLALGSPFAVLVAGHLYLTRTWRRNLLVAFFNVPVWFGWLFANVVMWYFQPGVPGALVIGTLLSFICGIFLLFLRFVREPALA